MKSASDAALEQQWNALVEALAKYNDVPTDRSSQTRFESVLDALFTCAQARRRKGLLEFEALLAERAGPLSPVRIWIALAQLHLARSKADYAAALSRLDALLEDAPPRTSWLVATNAARIVWDQEGPARSYQRIAEVAPFAGEEEWQYDSALVASGVEVTISLAITQGAADKLDEMARFARALWPTNHARRARVELLLIDRHIAQGHFARALKELAAIKAMAQGDVRLHWLCARLHALVGAGQADSLRARKTYRAFCNALPRKPGQSYSVPADERRRLRNRVAQIAKTAGWKKASALSASALTTLMQSEKEARRIKDGKRRYAALVRIIEAAEDRLLAPELQMNPEELVRMKLFWCRLVVDLNLVEMFDTCESILEQALRAAKTLDFSQLTMLTLDQRAVLRIRKETPDWKGAVSDSTAAAAIAIELLSNHADADSRQGTERAFLATLLPILDRVIDLHAEGAARVIVRNPQLRDEPLGNTAMLRDDASPRGTLLRFGRVIHTFVEQSQTLGLAEARRAFVHGHIVPHRFAIAEEGETRIVVDSIIKQLPPGSAILQYFVFGGYVLAFMFGPTFFDWALSTISDERFSLRPDAAHRKLEDVLRTLRGWTQGEHDNQDEKAIEELHSLILPPKLEKLFSLHDIRHVGIVPHDVLYRVPFGRLETRNGPLLQRFALSIHPTGRIAAENMAQSKVSAPWRKLLGFVSGPHVDCLPQEQKALHAAGGANSGVQIVPVDGARLPTQTILEKLPAFDLVHFLCHGEEGRGFGRSPALRLGVEHDGRIELAHVARLSLHRCRLVVLQSCWTGWMDHQRTNPVQGFPQAFCDAGVRAVIAPLTKIPQALAPYFTEVFYRALRFLPAELALQRTLSVLRASGQALIADDAAAREALGEHGSMDVFEYRYIGATGLLPANVLMRLWGQVSFWWWERGLRRSAKMLTDTPRK